MQHPYMAKIARGVIEERLKIAFCWAMAFNDFQFMSKFIELDPKLMSNTISTMVVP